MTETWGLPTNDDQMARASERFRVAAAVIREIRLWREREGNSPPECVRVRAEQLGMTDAAYHDYWETFVFMDERQRVERQAIEDWAIHRVQPEWKRNPNPKRMT